MHLSPNLNREKKISVNFFPLIVLQNICYYNKAPPLTTNLLLKSIEFLSLSSKLDDFRGTIRVQNIYLLITVGFANAINDYLS